MYDDFDGKAETLNSYASLMHEPKPEYTLYTSVTEERNGVLYFVTEGQNKGINYTDNAIVCWKRDELKEIQSALHIAKVPYKNIDGCSTNDEDGIVLSTLHDMKGLEFKVVIIMDINKDSFTSKPYNWNEMNKKEQTNHLIIVCGHHSCYADGADYGCRGEVRTAIVYIIIPVGGIKL